MVFDDETEFGFNENTTSKESKTTEPQLEKYGVWVKKGPENLESPQEIPEVPDNFTNDSIIENDFIAPEQEQIESINEELDSLMDTEPSTGAFEEKTEIPVVKHSKEPEITSDFGMPDGLDIPGIDLSAFENNDIVAPSSDSSGEVSIDMDDFFSSDSGDGEVDLSSFFGDGDSIDFDDFMGGSSGAKKEPEIEDQEPLDIQLEFDDDFVLETKADPVSQVEFVGFDGESGEMSFDDLFDNIQDEGAAFPSDFGIESETPKITEVDMSSFATEDFTSAFMSDSPAPVAEKATESASSNDSAYDDASEFDDLLSSLDEATPLTETPEEAKAKKLSQDYDITVTMEEEDLSEEDETEEEENNDDLDDIALFQSEEDIENFKQQTKKTGAPVGGMKVLEAQSSMDFDEIDKILEGGDFSFPSDEVKDVTEDTVAAEGIVSEDISLDEISIEENSLETNSIDEIPQEENIDFADVQLEKEPVVNSVELDDFSDMEESVTLEDEYVDIEDNEDELTVSLETDAPDNSSDDISIEEPELEDSIELDDTLTLGNELDLEQSTEETELTESKDSDAFEQKLDETDIQQDNTLDETFSEIEETAKTEETLIEEPVLNIQDSDDDLLDMDFSEDIPETTENTETVLEETTNDTTELENINEQTLTEEQGETMIEENNITNSNEITAQPDNASTAILEKIAAEITSLRSEITSLRSEFNSLKTNPVQEEANISTPEESGEESSGFFSDDNEDETIALSGDELSNLMNNADFTTEETTGEEDSQEDAVVEESEEAIEEPVVEDEIVDEPVEEVADDETITNPLGDATELSDADLDTMDEYEDESFAGETEASDFADEDLQEPELDELQLGNDFDENDEDLQEEIDVPKDDELVEEQETNAFIESINAEEPTISETLTEDRLKYLEDSVEDAAPEQEEIAEQGQIIEEPALEEPVIDDTTEEIEESVVTEADDNIIEDEEDDEEEESSEPTEDVFNSPQWDNDVPSAEDDFEEPSVLEPKVLEPEEIATDDTIPGGIDEQIDEDFAEPIITEELEEDETVTEESQENVTEEESVEDATQQNIQEAQPVVKSATSATSKIQDDIKSVLVYMDQLLENLPEDKIEEFAKSEHFDTYKKLFNDLGISN